MGTESSLVTIVAAICFAVIAETYWGFQSTFLKHRHNVTLVLSRSDCETFLIMWKSVRSIGAYRFFQMSNQLSLTFNDNNQVRDVDKVSLMEVFPIDILYKMIYRH